MKGFLNNWELKILALASAIVLWFFVVGIENNSYRFPDPIEIHAVNVPSDMSVANTLGEGIIRIRGDQDVIKNLTKSNFDLSVDLKNAHEGEQDLPVSATSNNDKVTILKVEPATVHVVLEPVTEKDIKVKTVITGNAAKGYSVSNVDVTPQAVTVRGGKSLLSKLTSIDADIKLDGSESTNFKQTVTLKLPDEFSSANNVTLSPDQVLVEVTIVQDLQQKTVAVKPDFQGSLDLTLMSRKIVITPETVTIQGKADTLKDIDSVTTEPVSYDVLKSSTTPIKAKLVLPKGTTIPDSQPNAVSISLTAP
jgi:YbbR domain-containing protein